MSGVGEAAAVFGGVQLLTKAAQQIYDFVSKNGPRRVLKQARAVIYSEANTQKFDKLVDLNPAEAKLLEDLRDQAYTALKNAAELCAQETSIWSIHVRVRWVRIAKASFKDIKDYQERLDEASTKAQWDASHRKLYPEQNGTPKMDNTSSQNSTSSASIPLHGTKQEDVEYAQLSLYSFDGKSLGSLIDLQHVLIAQCVPPEVSIPSDAQIEVVAEVQVETKAHETLQNTPSKSLNIDPNANKIESCESSVTLEVPTQVEKSSLETLIMEVGSNN